MDLFTTIHLLFIQWHKKNALHTGKMVIIWRGQMHWFANETKAIQIESRKRTEMAHRFVLSVNYGQLLFETIAHKDLLSSGRELRKKDN